MNQTEFFTIISWYSRNKRHQMLAEMRCHDYGLQTVQRSVCVGILTPRARRELELHLRFMFDQKHERVAVFTSCRSCITGATLGLPQGDGMLKTMYQELQFEIVQSPKNLDIQAPA